jgi:hypothetical protein
MNTMTLSRRKTGNISPLTLPAADRATLKRPAPDEGRTPPKQTRQVQRRFVLKIDGQAKKSFDDKEAALQAGREIKSQFPVVRAAVYDSQEGNNEIC